MDPVHFSGQEILEMAVRIEENGLKFYTTAGAAAESAELKELFDVLAGEEKTHIKVFGDLKDDTGRNPQEGFDPYLEEGTLYLKAIADTEVFTDPERGANLAKQVTSEKDAIRVAIDMEKDSLLFYYELQKMIKEKDRPILEHLIDQEKDHVRKLNDIQNKLGLR